MPQTAPFKPKYVFLGVEANEGEGVAFSSTSVLVTEEASMEIGVNGETTVHNYDGPEELALDTPEETTGMQNTLSFNTPWAFPDVHGTAGPMDDILRICGFNPVYDAVAKTTTYERSELSAIDTGHFSGRMDKVDTKEVENQAKGARGTFDLDIEIGKRMMLNGVNLAGAYIRPEQIVAVTPDYGTSKTNIGASCTASTVTSVLVDGNEVCIQESKLKNASAIKLTKTEDSCTENGTVAENENSILTMLYKKPDFDSEFNPHELGESHQTINRVAVSIVVNSPNKGKVSINLLVQPKMPKRVAMKGGNTGFSQEMKVLDVATIVVSEAD